MGKGLNEALFLLRLLLSDLAMRKQCYCRGGRNERSVLPLAIPMNCLLPQSKDLMLLNVLSMIKRTQLRCLNWQGSVVRDLPLRNDGYPRRLQWVLPLRIVD